MKLLYLITLTFSFSALFGQNVDQSNQLFLNNSEIIKGEMYRLDSIYYFKKGNEYYYVIQNQVKLAPNITQNWEYDSYEIAMVEAWTLKKQSSDLAVTVLLLSTITAGLTLAIESNVVPIVGFSTTFVLGTISLFKNAKGNKIAKDASIIYAAKPYPMK